MVTGGLSVLSPKLTDTGIAATNNRNFVRMPNYKSKTLAKHHLPKINTRWSPSSDQFAKNQTTS